ncbi:hypothetical protein [Acinetobacter larvae]|uniref:Methyl-coenzyme M reductase n=1 Tax=Acinetobacter larvae TaxID=1789224 RepID=A0A1B2LXB7_9GAMM|nr:hypothetical protein [Acinetobacter larvae]AOA57575.1 hypothetical protein BFG52_03875 [Acinetobacter larvae]
MARIPMGNFGETRTQAERINLPQDQSGQMLAGALQNVSGVAQQVKEKNDREQEKLDVQAKNLELYLNSLDKRDGQLKVDEVLSTDFSDKVAELRQQVGNGALDAKKAAEDFKAWSDERYQRLMPTLPGHAENEYRMQWQQNVNKQIGNFLPLQLKAADQKEAVLADRAYNIATRMDRSEGKQWLGEKLLASNIPEAQKQQYMINYETDQDKLEVESGIESAFSSGSIDNLRKVQESLNEKKYLSGQEVQRYSASISSKISTLQQRQEIEENKRLNEAGKVLNNFETAVLTGIELGDELINNTAAAVKGTQYEADFNFYLKQSKDFQRFSKQSSSAQLSEINNFKAKRGKSDDPVAENKILSAYESIYAENLKEVKENPTQALKKAGVNVPDFNPATLKVDPANAAKTIATIGSYQVALKDKDANVKISPISTEDLPQAIQSFDSLDINGKLNFIGQMIESSKNSKGGDQIWGAALKQLGAGNQSYVMAGVAKKNGFKSNDGRDVSSLIVIGAQALKNKQLIMPKDELLQQEFGKYVGNSATGETANMTFDAFKSIYAALTQQKNYQHKDKDDLDKKSIKQAAELSTGGVYEQNMKFGNSKWKVSKPWGMDDDRFEAIMETRYDAIVKKYNISSGGVRDLRIHRESNRGPGGVIRYSLLDARGTPLYYINMPDGVTK